MRTTLTLDNDVARLLEEAVRREHTSLKAVVNQAIRRALAPGVPAPARFVVIPHLTELEPGHDPSRLNQLVDDLEVESFLKRSAGSS